MKRFIMLICIAVALLITPGLSLGDTVTSANGIIAQERVVDLPQDAGRYYLTLFGDPTDPEFNRLRQWVRTDPGLAKLRSQTHFREYDSRSAIYQQRYAKNMPDLPCIRIQDRKGVVKSEFWAQYIPITSEALYSGICNDLNSKTEFFRRRRICPQPRPQPQPQPQPVVPQPLPQPIIDTPPELPEPDPVVQPEPVEPVVIEPESAKKKFPYWLAILSGLIGGAVGFYQGWDSERSLMKKSSQ